MKFIIGFKCDYIIVVINMGTKMLYIC